MAKKIKDFILNIFEVYGGKISNWSWRKRWNRRNSEPHKHYLRGEKK